MVAINEILLRECTGDGCGGDNNICTDSRVHCGDAENRVPTTRNHRGTPSPPELQAWSDATAPWMPFNSYGGWTEPFDGVLK